MRLYLDDDTVNRVFVEQMRRTGHDVQIPRDVGLMGESDPVHLLHAIQNDRVFISFNYDDFEELHKLVAGSGGHHPGIFIVRRERDRRRNMSHGQVVAAISRLITTGVTIANSIIVLNHWR